MESLIKSALSLNILLANPSDASYGRPVLSKLLKFKPYYARTLDVLKGRDLATSVNF